MYKFYHKRQPFILIQENTGAEGTTNPNGETTPTNAGSETPESGATTPPETGPTSPTGEETTPQAGNQKPPTGIVMLQQLLPFYIFLRVVMSIGTTYLYEL